MCENDVYCKPTKTIRSASVVDQESFATQESDRDNLNRVSLKSMQSLVSLFNEESSCQ